MTVAPPAPKIAPVQRKEAVIQLVVGDKLEFVFEKMKTEAGMTGFLGVAAHPDNVQYLAPEHRPSEEVWVPIANIVSIGIAPFKEPEV